MAGYESNLFGVTSTTNITLKYSPVPWMPCPNRLGSFRSLNGDIIDHSLLRNAAGRFQGNLRREAGQIKLPLHGFLGKAAAWSSAASSLYCTLRSQTQRKRSRASASVCVIFMSPGIKCLQGESEMKHMCCQCAPEN